MKPVVCNAGPLIALAGIGQLRLLEGLFGEVLVADEVRAEVEAGSSKPGAGIFGTSPWLRVTSLASLPDPLLVALLDRGEAATIGLAIERSAALVLMDEAKGRKIARDVYGLPVAGTGRILVEAKCTCLIPAVSPLLDRMRANGYWISDRITSEILKQAGEQI